MKMGCKSSFGAAEDDRDVTAEQGCTCAARLWPLPWNWVLKAEGRAAPLCLLSLGFSLLPLLP